MNLNNNVINYKGFRLSLISFTIILVALGSILFGITAYNRNPYKYEKKYVKIKKIISKDQRSCDKSDNIINTRYGKIIKTFYNCDIYVDFEGEERIINIVDSITNYIVDGYIEITYNSENIKEPLTINKFNIDLYWKWFIILGLIIIIMTLYDFLIVDMIKIGATFYGTSDLLYSLYYDKLYSII